MKRRLAVVALVLAILAACGPVANPGNGSSPTPSASATPTSRPTATPTVTPTPEPTISPSAAWPPAGFTTAGASGGSAASIVKVTAVRVGSHAGYDRLVLEFSGAVPTYTVALQNDTQFTTSPRGATLQLDGTNGVLVVIHHIDWTAYQGPTSVRPLYPVLREARLIENFEATQQWAIGVAGTPAVRVLEMSSPPRLVVDITAR